MANVREWVADKLQEERYCVEVEPITARVTARLRGDEGPRIDKLAAALGMTRNGLAEQLMSQALAEAWEVYYQQLDTLERMVTDEEIQRQASDEAAYAEHLREVGQEVQ